MREQGGVTGVLCWYAAGGGIVGQEKISRVRLITQKVLKQGIADYVPVSKKRLYANCARRFYVFIVLMAKPGPDLMRRHCDCVSKVV